MTDSINDKGNSLYLDFLAGSNEALAELVDIYRRGLEYYLTGILGNPDDAEDIAEEAFFTLCYKKPKHNMKASFKTWLYTIARNLAYDMLKKASKKRETSVESLFDISAEIPAPDELFDKAENKDAVRGALDRLKPEYRQILYLIYYEGFTVSEAAAVLQMKSHNTSVLLSRAKESLKKELLKEGFEQ